MTPQNCVFCQSAENLNTELNIKLDDGSKVSVQICDEHSDKSPKEAKEAYLNAKNKIDGLLAQLQAMGIQMAPQGQLVLPTTTVQQPAPQPAQRAQPVVQVIKTEAAEPVDARSVLLKREFDKALPTSTVDKKRNNTSIGSSFSGHGGFERHTSLDTAKAREALSEGGENFLEGVVQVESVQGRCGVPIQVPTKRLDGTGMTRITIVKTTDNDIQTRFRNLNDAPPVEGYQIDVRPCPVCRGQTVVKDKGREVLCPKCNGSGEISI